MFCNLFKSVHFTWLVSGPFWQFKDSSESNLKVSLLIFTNVLRLLELRSVMKHASPLLHCRHTLSWKTAGETFDILPSLAAVEKINFCKIKFTQAWEYSMRYDWLNFCSVYDPQAISAYPTCYYIHNDRTFFILTNFFFAILIAYPSKWMFEMCVMSCVHIYIYWYLWKSSSKCVGYVFVRGLSAAWTGKNFLWWN